MTFLKKLLLSAVVLMAALALTSCGDGGSSNEENSSTSNAITAFSFTSAQNTGLSADISGTISDESIAVTVPYGTTVTALVATFTTTGTSVSIGSAAQTSGVSSNDFTSPVTYTVTAADGSTQDYTVTVTIAVNSAKEITAFGFTSANNSVLSTNVTGAISGTSISVTVPYGTTSIANLIATFTTTGASVAIGTTEQTSGTTVNDFSSAKTYTVTAVDGSTQSYTVTVTVALASSKEITSFSFPAVTWTEDKTINAYGTTISGTAITVKLPYIATATSMVASFTTTGASVKIGSTEQTSGTTANDFSSSKTYTVTAADGSTQDYTVTVLFAPAVNSGWNTMNGGKLSTYWVVYDHISATASDINPVFRCDAINAGSDNFTMVISIYGINCSGQYFLPYNLSAEGATITQYDNYIKIVAPLTVIQTLINKITLIPPNAFTTEDPSGGCELYMILSDKNGLYSRGISYLDVY